MIVIPCEQYSEAWWAARKGKPTASRFGEILTAKTMKPSASARGYICELIAESMLMGPPEWIRENDVQTRAMANGAYKEPEAREWYGFSTLQPLVQVGFVTTDDGRFGCSPDALVGDDGGLELKCPLLKTHIGYLLDGGLPADYMGQVHGSMIVTGRKWWDFLSYCPGLPPLLVHTEWSEYTDKLQAALDPFFELYVSLYNQIASRYDRPTVNSPF
jgi:hypothetical protein